MCDEIKPCTKADASGRRQRWQRWREGDGRKEGCPSLWQPSASRVQGRPLCFFALPSLLLTRPGLFRGMQKLEKRPDGLSTNYSIPTSSPSLLSFSVFLPPLPPSLSSRVFCYLFFCLTFAYKDVCIVEVAPLQGWGSKEWFTLDVLFIFMEVGSLQIVTGYSCLSFVYNTIVIFKMYHEYLLLWGGLVFKLVQCSRASYCFQLEKIALSLVA